MVLNVLSILVVLIGILSIAVAPVLAARRGKPPTPQHQHWIVRLLCAALCGAALVAVGVGTWRGTRADLSCPQVTVLRPTRPPPPLALPENYGTVDLGPCKLIGTVLVARMEHNRLLPQCGESLVIDWPAGVNAERVFQGTCHGITYAIDLNPLEFFSTGKDGGIQARNGPSFFIHSLGFSSNSSGGSFALDTLKCKNFGNGFDADYHAPFSVIPVDGSSDLRLLVHLTRADRDDPLERLPAAQWLADIAGEARQDEVTHNSYRGLRDDPNVPPGIRMLRFLGPSALLLLIAAIAAATCFSRGRRAVAFAGWLTLMVLYAGALDGLVLQRRAGLAGDSSAAEPVRATALGGMLRGTFFHRTAALARLRAIAADPALPETLRQDAGSMSEE